MVHFGEDKRGRQMAPAARALVWAGVLALAGLVALLSRPLGGSGPAKPPPALPAALLNAGAFVLAALASAGVVATAFALWPRRRRAEDEGQEEQRRPPWWQRLLASMLSFGLTVGAVLWLTELARRRGARFSLAGAGGGLFGALGKLRVAGGGPPMPGSRWLPLTIALGVLVVIAGTTMLLWPRHPTPPDEDEDPDGLPAAVSLAIAEIENNPADPRRAVIAAYARMERALSAYGLSRRPAEAPFEYLSRVLRQTQVNQNAAASLTELYELAKFSRHDITVGHRERALQALRDLRQQLQPHPVQA